MAQILLSVGIKSLDRKYAERFCVEVLLPMGRFGEGSVRYLLEYLCKRKPNIRATRLHLLDYYRDFYNRVGIYINDIPASLMQVKNM